MNLRRTRYFVAVAEALHFGKAASQLNVVQPAVSQQIRLLEAELGTHLLERSSRKVTLTEAGRVYLAEAKKALQQFDAAVQAARDVAGGLAGSMTIGFVDSALWSPMPKIIHEYRRKFPNIELSLVQMPLMQQLVALQNGELDAGILPGPVVGDRFIAPGLIRDRLVVVLPKGHPLGDQQEVAIGDLADEPFIAIPSADNSRRINEVVQAICAQAGFSPKLGQPVEQLHTAISLVSAGFGVTIVPSWMHTAWTEGVEYRPISPRMDYSLHVVVPKDRVRPAMRHLLDLIGEFGSGFE